jgi:hypothetical protein
MADIVSSGDSHRRIYVLWAVGLGLLIALGLACWLFVAPVLRVRAIAEETGRTSSVPQDAIERLGGRQRAAAAIGLYFRAPRRLAPDRIEACCVLSHCGPHIMPVLRLALADENAACRSIALQLAAHMGRHGTGAVPQTIELLRDKDRQVRFQAITTLAVVATAWAPGPVTRRQPTAWSYTYSYSQPGFLRGLRAPTFAPFEPGAESTPVPMSRETVSRIVAGLAQTMSDADPEVATAAAQALLNYMPDATEAVPGLAAALASREPAIRTNAAALLAEIGPGAAAARPALAKCLGDPDEGVRLNAVIAVGRIVADKTALREVLKPVVDDSSEAVKRSVAKVLVGRE